MYRYEDILIQPRPQPRPLGEGAGGGSDGRGVILGGKTLPHIKTVNDDGKFYFTTTARRLKTVIMMMRYPPGSE